MEIPWISGSDRPLILDIPEITSASVIWANGGEVYRAGQVGTSAGETKTSIRSDLVAVVPQNRVLELVVQVANFHMYDGGCCIRRNPAHGCLPPVFICVPTPGTALSDIQFYLCDYGAETGDGDQ